MQKRCDRNRKRSKRRAIFCPIHGCHLESASQKHSLFTDCAAQLQQRGIKRRNALLLVSTQTTVSLTGEWLEAFWCEHCQETKWYHVRKQYETNPSAAATYHLSEAPSELWQQVAGVIHPDGNPSVGEFTRRQARRTGYRGAKDFAAIH